MLYGHVHDTQDQRLLEQFQEINETENLLYESFEQNNKKEVEKNLEWKVLRVYSAY